MPSQPDPVTLLIANTVKSGRETEYQDWLSGINEAARQFEGYNGTQALKSSSKDNRTVQVLIHFRDCETLTVWEESDIRKQWLDKLPELAEVSPPKRLEGIEFWFNPPKSAIATPPPRYRMALITLLAIYPQTLLIPPLLSAFLPKTFPSYAVKLVTCLLIVTLMTWVVMPIMNKVFAFWLFRKKEQ